VGANGMHVLWCSSYITPNTVISCDRAKKKYLSKKINKHQLPQIIKYFLKALSLYNKFRILTLRLFSPGWGWGIDVEFNT